MEHVTIDWRNRRMSGHARVADERGLPSYFDVDMISHVEGNLWQGGCEHGLKLDDDFVRVVSLYQWERYDLGPNTERIEFKMYDSHDGVDWDDLDKASELVVEGVAKGKTLVHCQAGLNRSGLVAGVALMKMGKTAQQAIDLLRKSRSPLVLCNQTFVQQLHELQAKMEENS
jgi:protein-tyrosine phosphatase